MCVCVCVCVCVRACVANGKYYKKFGVAVLAAVLKGVVINKISGPERVTKLCKKYHLVPGDSFDLRTGYDLSDEKTQAMVMNKIDKSRPALVIGSPPCTMFSRLQQLNLPVHGDAWRAKFEIEKKKAIAHIVFCVKVCRLQIARGAYFFMEHPAHADSWKLLEIIELK